jgi:hypothetical protein
MISSVCNGRRVSGEDLLLNGTFVPLFVDNYTLRPQSILRPILGLAGLSFGLRESLQAACKGGSGSAKVT